MLQAGLVVLAAGVAVVYFTIAAVVVPKIGLGDATGRFTALVRAGAIAFFIGCGLTHVHIAVHALDTQPAPHELFFHVFQLVGGAIFVFAAIRYLDISIEPREQHAQRLRVAELERLSLLDPLTGVHNRRHFEAEFAAEIERQRRYGGSVAIVLLDVDEFKAINDRRGHAVGDEVLIGLALMALATVRSVDSIARIGGDEFALLLPETNGVEALAVADRLRVDFAEHLNGAGRVSLSAGVAAFPDDGVDAITLQVRADEALYAAKRGGRNACTLAGGIGVSGS